MIEVVDYEPRFAEAFRTINLEWVEEMFAVEAADLAALNDPEGYILADGGQIRLALLDKVPVGAGALKCTGPGEFELTKMGVLRSARGKRVGAILLDSLLSRARELQARRLYLLTNWDCEAAIHLYEKHGFVHDSAILEEFGGTYQRADVGMSYPMIWDALPEEMDTVRELFREYSDFLDFDLCFQDFERELADLPGLYAPPRGAILLTGQPGKVVGCIALRPLGEDVCEMKRLYVRPQGRSQGLGRRLCVELIERAKSIGYQKMKLDTVSKLKTAIGLYQELGFRECEQYCANPQPDVQFFELDLG